MRVEQTELVVGGGPLTTTVYHIDPLSLTGYAKAIEERVNGALERSYAVGLEIISQATFGTTPGLYFFLHDGHGSTRALLNSAGGIATIQQLSPNECQEILVQLAENAPDFTSQLLFGEASTDYADSPPRLS